jgi:hypothetical protein
MVLILFLFDRFDLPQQLHLHVRFPGQWLQMEKVQKLSNQVKERLLRS